MTNLLLMAAASFGGGFVQSATGFGAGIVMMMILPMFLSVLQSSGVFQVVCVPLQLAMIWTYRKHIRLDYMIKPAVFYFPISLIAIRFAVHVSGKGLKLMLGLVLIALALYFFLFSKQAKIKATWTSAGICGTIAAVISGFFGLSGPPMALYYLAVTEGEKFVYLGTIQTFFLVTGLYTTVVRLFSGIFTPDLIPYICVGFISIIGGQQVGKRFVEKIDRKTMSRLVYLLVGISGLINVINSLPL